MEILEEIIRKLKKAGANDPWAVYGRTGRIAVIGGDSTCNAAKKIFGAAYVCTCGEFSLPERGVVGILTLE